jgi:hypothetical protein
MAYAGIAGAAIWLAARCVCLAGMGGAPPASAVASASDESASPYSVIMERNAFRLNPPPLPAEASGPPQPDLPQVKLSGFMQTANQWKALLAVKVKNPDPRAAPLNSYLTLAEGEKERVTSGEHQFLVEMGKIYAEEEKADIINSGTLVTLSMKDNGFGSPPPPPDPAHAVRITPEMQKTLEARKAFEAAFPQPAKPPPKVPGKAEAGAPGAAAAPVEGEKSGAGGMPVDGVPPAGVAPSLNRAASNNSTVVIVGGPGGTAR